MELPIDIARVKGFLDPDEGRALYDAAFHQAAFGPCLEIGSYCGKSAVYLGSACRARAGVLFSVDHHRGSEENQPGELFHDADLFDRGAGRLDTLPAFRETLREAGLEETVIPIVGRSEQVARYWAYPLRLLFVDGGHSQQAAMNDFELWTPHLAQDGVLAIHDVFPDAVDGGRPPFEIYTLALRSGDYEEIAFVKSLALLRKVGAERSAEKIGGRRRAG